MMSSTSGSPSSKRRHPRSDVSAPACAFSGERLYPCVIRDMSRGGARIEVPPGIELGPRFSLFIGANQPPVESVVVWRRDRLLGLRFV